MQNMKLKSIHLPVAVHDKLVLICLRPPPEKRKTLREIVASLIEAEYQKAEYRRTECRRTKK